MTLRVTATNGQRACPHLARQRASIAIRVVVTMLLWATPISADARQGGEPPVTEPGQALIRVVHASPDAPALDLYAGERIVASGLLLGDVTGFLPVADGQQALSFVPAGGDLDTAIVETRFDLVDGGVYEVVALGQLREIDGRIYEVDRSRFESPEFARLRFLHFSPDVGEVNVSIAREDTLFDGADFADATGYSDLIPGQYTVTLLDADPTNTTEGPLATLSLEVVQGVVYDIVAIGLQEQQTLGLLPLTALSDVPCGSVLGVGGAGDACVQVVHASVDTPPFDVFVDGGEAPLVRGIGFATSSVFVPIPAGEHSLRMVVNGSSDGEVLRETTVDIAAGEAYAVAAMDMRAQLDVRALEIDLSPLGAGQARMCFVHAMPNQSGLTLALTTGEVIYADLEFPNASPSIALAAVPIELSVLPAAEGGNALATLGIFEPTAGMIYMLFVIGDGEGVVENMLILPAPVTPISRSTGNG